MVKDISGFKKAIEVMLSSSPAGIAKMGPRIKKLMDNAKKDKGKPKGRSPSMILGSASKAGMQSKQGQKMKRPGFPGIGPLGPKKKTNGREGNMVENFRKNRKIRNVKKGKRAF